MTRSEQHPHPVPALCPSVSRRDLRIRGQKLRDNLAHDAAAVLIALGALFATAGATPASAQTKLLRFPDIRGDQVVFCHAGDIWLASANGGPATRLTAHPGQEVFPKFSPDGKWIAFTGQYDGDEQVYVIPATGGVPKQLTWYPARGPLSPRWGYDNQVYGWTRDGSAVLFRSFRDHFDLGDTRLYTVAAGGGNPEPLPMPYSGGGDISPDGKRVVYSPLARDFRTWKRYQGGWAQDLYIFDLASSDATNLTDNARTDRDPMWIGDRVYFASDRDGTLNIYSADPANPSDVRQLTHSAEWDVRWPSADHASGRIVYEMDGELNVLDTKSGESRGISIFVPNDGTSMRPARVSAAKQIEDFELAPKGKRALFVARGDIFTAPIEKGPTRNLTNLSTAHDKSAVWSPDGSKIAFISDKSGEDEIYLIDQDGSGEPAALTSGGEGMRFALRWAPDGKRLAFSDKEGRVWIVGAADKKLTQVADERQGQTTDYSWSPDGNFLAVGLSDSNGYSSVHIWSVADGRLRRVTGDMWSEYGAAWDPSGDYLYYLSDREFAPQVCSVEWNYVVDRETEIFALALRKDVKHPFPPESDEVETEMEGDAKGGSKDKSKAKSDDDEGDEDGDKKDASKSKKPAKPISIDWDGLAQRVARVPVDAGNYAALSAIDGHLLYVSGTPFYYGRDAGTKSALQIFSFEDREASEIVDDVKGYALSPDGSKLLVSAGKDYKLYDAKPEAKDPKTISTADLEVDRVPAEEWAAMFDEVWRRYRDFFYVPNMHGYDWEAIGARYRDLLKYVAHRSDLNYVLGEMVSELNVSHAYVSGGDFETPERPKVALPGCRFELDRDAGRHRISKIFAGQNEEERYRSPLTEIGVDARVGDYVLAIDGEDLVANDNPYRLLKNKADRPVTMTLNSRPDTKGAREVTFNPITSETDLIYLDWITHNREQVDKMTNGRAGYIHIPDMGGDGIREFIKHFYGQIRKEGLVIDVRGNGGGNVSQMLIERLRREMLRVRFVRTFDEPLTYPSVTFNGHFVCLLNETSASDGDIFPAMFKEAGLGPLIGVRSWGGVIGITDHGPLLDGGSVSVPQFGTNDRRTGEFIIEGHGVDPDIIVQNDPKSVIAGRDPQLERGVAELLRAIEGDPKRFPPRPIDPVRTQSASAGAPGGGGGAATGMGQPQSK
jgi:tricorn protease